MKSKVFLFLAVLILGAGGGTLSAGPGVGEELIFDRLYEYFQGVKIPPWGELDLKVGLDAMSGLSFVGGSGETFEGSSTVPSVGFSLGVEYKFPLGDFFAIGAGFQYLIPRKVDGDSSFEGRLSYLPLYAIFQVHPLLPNLALQFKVGYSWILLQDMDIIDSWEVGGVEEIGQDFGNGFTWGVGLGITATRYMGIELSYYQHYNIFHLNWDDGKKGTQWMVLCRFNVAFIWRVRFVRPSRGQD